MPYWTIKDWDSILLVAQGQLVTVCDINVDDNGNRSYITAQIPEAIEEKTEAYKAGYKKISNITIERNKRVINNMRKPAQSAGNLFSPTDAADNLN